jgi:hypothetical protein
MYSIRCCLANITRLGEKASVDSPGTRVLVRTTRNFFRVESRSSRLSASLRNLTAAPATVMDALEDCTDPTASISAIF